MNGYAVAARVQPDSPRWVDGRPEEAADAPWQPGDSGALEMLAPGSDPLLGERWEAFRDRWSQLTFFLFDGDSWRR